MKIQKIVGVAALLATLPMASNAANFNYNYGQIDYQSGDFDGFGVSGTFEINDEIFVRAGYIGATNDDAGFDIDYTRISVGAGYHMPIITKTDTDAVFTVSIVNEELDNPTLPGGSVDETGIMLTAGVRHNLNSDVELAGDLFYIDALDGDFGIYGEARYNINKDMSAGIGFTSSDHIDGLSLNFRFGF